MDKAREMVSQAAGHSVVASVALNGVVVAERRNSEHAERIVLRHAHPCFFFKENKRKMMPSAAAIAAAVKPVLEISTRE